jgi:hypothetical protein
MDLSKLPRLSETDKHAPQPPDPESLLDPQPADRPPVVSPMPAATVGPEAWFSIGIGVILLLMFPRFLQWASSRVLGTHFNEFVLSDGTIVPYPQVPTFWMDLGPTLFGIVLILEGVALVLARNRLVVWFAFVLTVAATAYNIGYLVMSYSTQGLALVSAFAGLFGVYIAMYQWRMLHPAAVYRA